MPNNNTRICLLKRLIRTIVFICFISCVDKQRHSQISNLLGIDSVSAELLYSISESSTFGEGYSLEIYRISENDVENFLNASKKLTKLDSTGGYHSYNWSNIKPDTALREVFVLGLNYYSGNEDLKNRLSQIKKILNKSNTYFSFYYKPNLENPRSVQLFILDCDDRIFYLIENNQ